MPEVTEARIHELERRVNLLTAAVVVEAVVLGRFFPYLTVGFVLLLPILVFTHQRLPGLARRIGRMLAPVRRSSVVTH